MVTAFNGRRTVTAQRDRPPASYRDHVTDEMPEGVPRYQEIADSLRERIENDELPPGAMLPSIARISQEWAVSETTAANAIKLLHSEGLIRTAQGGETFVAGPDD
jgi:DNA-binding GntR family transcriptional regulator